MEEERKMLTVKEAAAKVHGITEYRIREMIREGKLPYMKAGKKFLIPEDAVMKAVMKYVEEISTTMSTVK